jgi:hypothetical protein
MVLDATIGQSAGQQVQTFAISSASPASSSPSSTASRAAWSGSIPEAKIHQNLVLGKSARSL